MGQIRKQVIQSSFLSYIGFIVGAINTYFFTKQGLFIPEQYGLIQVVISMSQILAPLATLGMAGFIGKFFPYYFGRLDNDKNDMLAVAVVFSGIGAFVVFGGCLVFEPLLVRKFSARSVLVVKYFYWTLLFSFFYLCFMILESYLNALKRTVLPNFMKETVYRTCVSILIVLFALGIIDYGSFVMLFCSIYLVIVIIILTYLRVTRQLFLSFSFSQVTRRLRKNVTTYVSYVYAGITINSIARQIDTLALASVKSLHDAGVYSLNQFMAAILQVPQRGLLGITGPLIAEHWKNKNYPEIKRIYHRSSINLLLISTFLFFNIWLNYNEGLQFLGVNAKYSSGRYVFFILGISSVFDLAVGVTAAIIITSPAWRFEFYCNLILLLLSIPLNIALTRAYGMEGTSFAILTTFFTYNIIRLVFIKRRFNMWPFSRKTIYAILLVTSSYFISWLLFHQVPGLGGILLRSALFSGLFFTGVFYLQLTPDLPQFIAVVKKKLNRKK